MSSNVENSYRDAQGNFYLVKDVAALGDCAVLSVLCHPNFHAPLTDVQELRRAVVSFAQSAASQDCAVVYTALKPLNAPPFQLYLQQVMQPRFWVGTEFFVWVTMLYGVEIIVHYLDNHKNPQTESTVHLLRSALPNSHFLTGVHGNPISVLFHQYNNMLNCLYERYNHFAILLHFPSCPTDPSTLINSKLQSIAVPRPPNEQWWKNVQGVDKSIDTKSKKAVKESAVPSGKKSSMTKEEWKKKQRLITANYVQRMSRNQKQATLLMGKLEAARQRALEVAKALNVDEDYINVDDDYIDLPVRSKVESLTTVFADVSVALPRSLTGKIISRSWIQRAYILFIYLHPRMGNKDLDYTCQLTGVKGNTLLGWVRKSEMMQCWVPIVSALTANEVLRVLKPEFQECFQDIQGESTVCVNRYKNKIKKSDGCQLNIVFTGNNVSFPDVVCDVQCVVVC